MEWPKSAGVYVIWHKNASNIDNLIYIGMTGKFIRDSEDNVIFNKALFKSRVNRWTPYRFCESKRDEESIYFFKYGPKSSSVSEQSKIRYDLDAYRHSISYVELEIHCFQIDSNNEEYTPILLESLLLTKYLKDRGSLPPANNSL